MSELILFLPFYLLPFLALFLLRRPAYWAAGALIALGTPHELIESLEADQIVEFSAVGNLSEEALTRLPGVRRRRTARVGLCEGQGRGRHGGDDPREVSRPSPP